MAIHIYGEVMRRDEEPRRFSVRKDGEAAYALSVPEVLRLLRVTKEDCDKAFEEES